MITGIHKNQIGTEPLSGDCFACGAQNSLQLNIYQRYFQLFRLPLFPAGKTGNSYCMHCSRTLNEEEMSISMQHTYRNVKMLSRTPLYTFSGSLLILLIIGSISYTRDLSRQHTMDLMIQPHQGDVYEIQLAEEHYTLYKVLDVTDDTVFLLMSQYETDRQRGLNQLHQKGERAYSHKPVSLARKELLHLLQTKQILDVERK